MGTASRSTKALAGLFAVSGVLHFATPRPYERIVPKPLPRKRELVYLSGAADLASAALLAAIFPANVQMALDLNSKGSKAAKAAGFGRLPLQVPLIRAALKAAREGR